MDEGRYEFISGSDMGTTNYAVVAVTTADVSRMVLAMWPDEDEDIRKLREIIEDTGGPEPMLHTTALLDDTKIEMVSGEGLEMKMKLRRRIEWRDCGSNC